MPRPLPRDFYDRDPVTVAKELLGKVLVRELPYGVLRGVIVETEAYLAENDPANHAFVGRTERNKSMFGPPGIAYVYRIHQVCCLNAVTEPEGVPSAVLIRSLMRLTESAEPDLDEGLRTLPMTGPGRLCREMQIDSRWDGWDLTVGQQLWISRWELSHCDPVQSIGTGPRVGVTSGKDLPLRFWLTTEPMVWFVSKIGKRQWGR